MIDIHLLERRWIKYKIKRLIPYVVAILGIGAGLITLLYSVNQNDVTPPPPIKQEIPLVKITPKPDIAEEVIAIVPPPTLQQPRAVAAPIAVARPTPAETSVAWKPKALPSPKENIPVPLSIPKNTPLVAVSATFSTPVVVPPNSQNKPISIKQNSTTFDIHEIEDRFKNNSNPHLGLYIARYHYDNGNYSEAYNYALKTNAINNTLEESWLIFAKSLVKLGRTEQAKKTLQLYISQSNSEGAKSLLNNLTKEDEK
ncbi:MAG: hypothetical protein NTY39_04060 [Campylobacterales bacterium]|nr:hypothetical protein [Campylobacterales bacterium]